MDYESLSKPFDDAVLRSVKKGGANLTYVPIAEVIARVNRVLGPMSWSESSQIWRDSINPEWVIGHVTVTVEERADGDFRVSSTKEGWGGTKIKCLKDTNDPVDLGDDFKGAHSDALKKAWTHFGVGLELARKEEALDQEAWEKAQEDMAKAPKAPAEVVAAIKGGIDALTDEQKSGLRTWMKSTLPGVSVKEGALTIGHADQILEFLKAYET